MASKRSNGEGSITRYKDGRWCGRYWTQTTNGKKKRVAIYGKTKAEVRAKLTKAIADRDAGLILETESTTVEKYLRRWLDTSVKSSVKPTTYESYEYVVRVHLVPALGAKKLRDLSPAQVQDLYQWKLDSGLSRSTVQLIHATLHKALKQAMKRGLVARNVTEAVDAPKPQKKDIRPLTPEEVKVFLSTVKGDRLESLYILAITTGLRQGELLGLRWQDVDLNEKVVRVHQQLTRTKGGLSFSKPKNNKGRNVTLMDLAIKALMNHRERQKDEKLKMDDLWQETDLVFTSTKGTPLDASCLLKHSFRPLLKRAGLPHITFHCLRHTFATLFFSKGAHPKIVQEMLGHSNISVTMDVYSHMLPNMQGEVVRGIEENLF